MVINIIALASATGEKNMAPLARAKEGPKAPTQARSTEEKAEGPASDDSGEHRRPPKKKFSTKVEKLASAIIHDYVKLKTRLSRKRPS